MTHCLIGKILTGLQIAEDKKTIKFRTTEGDIVAKTDGDCCSNSWIENVEVGILGFPALVIEVEDINMPEQIESENDDYAVTTFYGFKITTDKGTIFLDYRNESNGYYGGSLCWPDDYFCGGIYGQNCSDEIYKDIPY
jgi:hypothetical protein